VTNSIRPTGAQSISKGCFRSSRTQTCLVMRNLQEELPSLRQSISLTNYIFIDPKIEGP